MTARLDRDYLTIKEAADYLHLSKQVIYRMIDEGRLEKRQLVPNGKILIPATSIEKLLEKA